MCQNGLDLNMVKNRLGKNTLPLLAITTLLLSIALVNYDKSLVSGDKSTQSVLSESDENEDREDRSDEDEGEEEKEEIRETERVEEREIKNETKKLNARTETIKVEEEIEIEEDFDDDDSDLDQDELEDEVETEFEEESEIASSDGTVSKFKLKIKTRTVAGKTIVETASGEVEVEKDPDDTINQLVDSGIIDEPVSFEAKVNNREKVEFEIQGTDSKKFLGIFNVVIPKLITVSSETGEVISTNQNIWSRILSLLSV